jgi:hypothetical protein
LKQEPEARRSAVVLTDDEVIALANVRLITDTYDVAPARVVELQRHGKDYVVIHRELAVAGSGGIAVAEGGDRVVVVEQGLTARAGFDMRGGDYSKIYLGSLGECQQTCADERQCRAYTYNTRDRMCYLKDRPTSYTPRSDTVSGEKSEQHRPVSLPSPAAATSWRRPAARSFDPPFQTQGSAGM